MSIWSLRQCQDFVAIYAPDGTRFAHSHRPGIKGGQKSYYSERYRGMERHYLPQLCELISKLPVGRAVDVGPGWGTMSVWMANHGWDVTAMDRVPLGFYMAPDMLRQLRLAGAKIDYLMCDSFSDPPGIQADLVLMSQVIPHMRYRPDIALRNVGKILRPGGSFVCVTLDREANTKIRPAYGFDWRAAPLPGDGNVSDETVTIMLDRYGLETLITESLGPCEVWRPEGSTCLFGKYVASLPAPEDRAGRPALVA